MTPPVRVVDGSDPFDASLTFSDDSFALAAWLSGFDVGLWLTDFP